MIANRSVRPDSEDPIIGAQGVAEPGHGSVQVLRGDFAHLQSLATGLHEGGRQRREQLRRGDGG